jgi:hypothetical protein
MEFQCEGNYDKYNQCYFQKRDSISYEKSLTKVRMIHILIKPFFYGKTAELRKLFHFLSFQNLIEKWFITSLKAKEDYYDSQGKFRDQCNHFLFFLTGIEFSITIESHWYLIDLIALNP